MKKKLTAVTCISAAIIFFLLYASLFLAEFDVDKDACAEEISGKSVILPIIMYHGILNSVKGKYLVSERQLNSDLTALEKAGYNYVFPSEVIGYAESGAPLPEKPVMITFDDGCFNNYFYGKSIIENHKAKALISTVGAFTERTEHENGKQSPHYSSITWTQMCELGVNECFEIGNHTFDMHKQSPRFGIGRMRGETDESYTAALSADALKMKRKLGSIGIESEVFTYPFGKYCDLARETLQDIGYKMFLTCNEGVNRVSAGNPESIECLYRINRDGAYSTEKLMHTVHLYEAKFD